MTKPTPAPMEPEHSHAFDTTNPLAERRTRQVMWLTAAMMVVEIVAGTLLGSMALLADGWHMSSHALALGVSAGAYALARRHAHDPRFAFGTWKIEVLGGYTSAVFLLGVAAYMGIESVSRLMSPAPIQFDEAIPVAVARPAGKCPVRLVVVYRRACAYRTLTTINTNMPWHQGTGITTITT